MSGTWADPIKVAEARKADMEYFRKMNVYTRVKRSGVKGKVVGTRWIDVNNADERCPDDRSRLVGKESKRGTDNALYAATPPLEGLETIVSYAGTIDRDDNHNDNDHNPHKPTPDKQIMINDVRRAHVYAPARRDVYIEIPAEDVDADPSYVGKLILFLYGTQDAAANWQETLSVQLASLGFTRGAGYPCLFCHHDRGIWTLVHGDDYVSAGRPGKLAWLKAELEKCYETKTQVVGPCESGMSEGKVLNRVLRWQPCGWELEADPRHCELVIEQLGLHKSKSLSTPGNVDDDRETEEDKVELAGRDVTRFRGLAARINYLALDRSAIQFASKEVCREMCKPTRRSLNRLTHLARDLIARPRVIWQFAYQYWPKGLVVNVDSNWAGCRRTRKSTSGGIYQLGLPHAQDLEQNAGSHSQELRRSRVIWCGTWGLRGARDADLIPRHECEHRREDLPGRQRGKRDHRTERALQK